MADEILPSPDLLQRYETIYKGSAKKIIDAFIEENVHRRALERRALEAEIEYTKRGQFFGLIIGLCAIVAGATTAGLGAEWSGAVIGGGGVIGLVSVFVIGHRRALPAHPKATPTPGAKVASPQESTEVTRSRCPMSRRFFGCFVLAARLLALGVALLTPPLPGAEPGSGSPSGTIRLASGLTAHYAYYSDRNALRDGRRSGDAVIALTESGNLLRLDLATLKPTRDWAGPVPAVCLGRGDEGGVLAGFKDGRVCRIDPSTLALTEFARLSGEIQWVGTMNEGAHKPGKSRLIAVVGKTNPVVHDLGPGKTYPFGRRASAFLLDRKQRLWLGADDGEWGGWCSYVDLQAGQVHPVAGPKKPGPRGGNRWSGVFGFTELGDGQVWAYGGTTHMFFTEGFLCRVDRGQAESLYELDNTAQLRRQTAERIAREEQLLKEVEVERNQSKIAGSGPNSKDVAKPEPKTKVAIRPEPDPLPVDRPNLPITQILEDPKTGAILVVSFSDVYRTDARLAHWAKVHELEIGYQWGRPDALGSYPSVCSVIPIEEPGKPLGLIFGTRFDGFVRLVDGKETRHGLPGQLFAEEVRRIEASSAGILAFDGVDEDDSEPWQFRDGAWSAVAIAPSYQPLPDRDDLDLFADRWFKTIALSGRDGPIVTISSSGENAGTIVTTRWHNGKSEVLGREYGKLNLLACFLTPDGHLWNAHDGILRHFVDGRWTINPRFPEPRAVDIGALIGVGYGLRAVNEVGPPWTLINRHIEQLLRLSHGPGFKDPRFNSVLPTEAGRPLKVREAISWTKAELMLLTDRGPKILALDGDKVTAAPFDTGGRSITRLCRDGRGRLWLGGLGLAVVEAGGKVVHPLDDLPMLGRASVNDLAADPEHADGVIASLGKRGVVFVRVTGN